MIGGFHLAPDRADDPISIDKKRASLHAEIGFAVIRLFNPCAIVIGKLMLLVARKRKVEAVFFGKPVELVDRVRADANDLEPSVPRVCF